MWDGTRRLLVLGMEPAARSLRPLVTDDGLARRRNGSSRVVRRMGR